MLVAQPQNWRVLVTKRTRQVVAVEPGGEFEHVFTGGPDPFADALAFAAARLKAALS